MTCLARTSGLPWPHTFPALLPLTTTPRPAHGKGKTNRPSRTWTLLCHQLLFSDHERFATAEKEILVTHKKPVCVCVSLSLYRDPKVSCPSWLSLGRLKDRLWQQDDKSVEKIVWANPKKKKNKNTDKKFKNFLKAREGDDEKKKSISNLDSRHTKKKIPQIFGENDGTGDTKLLFNC